MSNIPEPGVSPADRVTDVPRILAALRKAVREALMRHKKLGNPVAVWSHGRVEWIPPEEIPNYEDATAGVDE